MGSLNKLGEIAYNGKSGLAWWKKLWRKLTNQKEAIIIKGLFKP
jgi:hypothetical protein